LPDPQFVAWRAKSSVPAQTTRRVDFRRAVRLISGVGGIVADKLIKVDLREPLDLFDLKTEQPAKFNRTDEEPRVFGEKM
jgi:hypothetical protein